MLQRRVVEDEPASPMPEDQPPHLGLESQRLLLFVHGLAGTADSTWGNFPALIAADASLRRDAVKFYSYPTTLLRLPFQARSARIQELARGLKTFITYNCAEYSEIVLVAHSMGGLIAKRYVLDEHGVGTLDARIKGLMLYAVPHDGSSLAGAANLLSWGHHQVAQLRRYSDVLEAISSEWSRLHIEQRIRTKYVLGGIDKVVDCKSASAFPGNPNTETIPDKNHRTVVKPRDAEDLSFKILRRFVIAGTIELPGPITEAVIAPPMQSDTGPGPLSDEVLFFVYSTRVEPWYVKRIDDESVWAAGAVMSVWGSGPTGTGKTAALQRFLDLNGHSHRYISLAAYHGSPISSALRAIYANLASAIGGVELDKHQTDPAALVRSIAELLCRLSRDRKFCLFVEELPLDTAEEFRIFIEATYSLMIELGTMRPRHPVRLFLSSINDPSSHINGHFDKIRERMRFLHFGPWAEDDCGKLVDVIGQALKINVTAEERLSIVRACRGSPRFIKVLFGMAAGNFFPGCSLTDLVPKVTEEVFACA